MRTGVLMSILVVLAMGLGACSSGPSEEEIRAIVRAEVSAAIGNLEQGPQGERGPAGSAGPRGEQGPVGPRGPSGGKGPQGNAGPEGPQGTQGVPGCVGEQGSQGQDGPAGQRGPAGEPGLQGEPGRRGPVGPRGAQGPPGTLSAQDERRVAALEDAADDFVKKSALDFGFYDSLNLNGLSRCLDDLEDAVTEIARELRYGYGLYGTPRVSCSLIVGSR